MIYDLGVVICDFKTGHAFLFVLGWYSDMLFFELSTCTTMKHRCVTPLYVRFFIRLLHCSQACICISLRIQIFLKEQTDV